MPLQKYWKKRDFAKTSEPKGDVHPKAGKKRFVIQKHAASHLHYDFRLEMGGVLVSWAVPKGVPFAKGEKRLAMHVEDHPLSYRDFEGTIPKGQYGGGTVMVWDYGTFEPLTSSEAEAARELASGKLHFILHGKKLSGEWYLVRLHNRGRGDKQADKEWLLIRGGEDMKPVSKKLDDTSALSGKSMRELTGNEKGDKPKTLKKVVVKEAASKHAVSSRLAPPKTKASRKIPLLSFFDPMKAKLFASPPPGEWKYEFKYDGFRALAFLGKKGERCLLSRTNHDLGEKFPEVLKSIGKLKTTDTVLDGEIVALDAKGRSSFQLLQAYELGQEKPPLFYYVFDLPQFEGEDLRAEPLEIRQARLQKFLRRPPGDLRLSQVLEGDGEALMKQARSLGLEGLIGKRPDSVYEAGRRSGAWIKLKTHREQEFVIGGYTDPGGARSHFGALLIGYHPHKGKKDLLFCGKVGTGFNEVLLRSLHAQFRKIPTPECPFENLPEAQAGRYGSGVTTAEMKHCHWLKPQLVCQIKFSEWTRDGKLRQPVFLGLREDKDAKDVVREEPTDG